MIAEFGSPKKRKRLNDAQRHMLRAIYYCIPFRTCKQLERLISYKVIEAVADRVEVDIQ